MLAACKILGSPAPDNTTYKNSIGDGREIFSGCRAYVEAWNLSRRCGGQDFDRLKGSRLALGARPSTQRLGTYLTTTSLLDGRRVRRPQPRAEVLQSVRDGESRLSDIFRLNIKALEVRGRQALRAVDGAT